LLDCVTLSNGFFPRDDSEQPTDDLVQAHADLLESIRRSLKRLAGTAESTQEATALDKLMTDVMSCLSPSLDIEAVGVGMWLCDRVDRLKRISTCERITSQQYLVIVHTEIESWKSVIDEEYQTTEAYHYTRRMAIQNLVLFPSSLLTAVQWSSHTDYVAQEFLIQCAPCIMACSYLLNADGFATVEYMLPPYLRQLTKMAKLPSPLQKEAAYLATQGHCLMATVKLHRRQFDEQVAHCKKAVELAKVAGNRLLVAATLTRLGVAWFYFGKPEKYLETYQEAERLLKEEPALFPARLQICIYMGLSGAHTRLGHTQGADYYLGMANAVPFSFEDDLFIPALDFDLSEKISWEGSIDINIGELEEKKGSPTKAESWYKKAAAVLAQKLPPGFPERTLLQTINHQGALAIKLGDKENFILYVKEGALRSKELGSKQRKEEVMANICRGKHRWPREQDVLKLDELFDSDEDE
jgi:tetratricopeptide (TPR) repeat protein